jgi:hypothetical protein
MRQSLGTAVFAGMIGVTLFGIFLTPVFYYAIMGLTGQRQPGPVAIAGSAERDDRPRPEPAPGQDGRREEI